MERERMGDWEGKGDWGLVHYMAFIFPVSITYHFPYPLFQHSSLLFLSFLSPLCTALPCTDDQDRLGMK